MKSGFELIKIKESHAALTQTSAAALSWTSVSLFGSIMLIVGGYITFIVL